MSRRRALTLGAAAAATVTFPPVSAPAGAARPTRTRLEGRRPARSQAADALRPTIRPRADWAGDLGVTGELVPEDDVRFLLVHHTASTNDYGPDEVAGQLRGFYQFHTGPDKGWPDVAYNFFVDRHGGIWEGRQGSLAGPVRGDATGGSQGHALLCSLVGNHATEPLTPEAQAALVQLLAWLGASYDIDTAPGVTTTFVSRGSNRWAAGTEVVANTISGHRDMSQTSCPGDRVYALLDTDIPDAVTALRTGATSDTSDTTATTDPGASPESSDSTDGSELSETGGSSPTMTATDPTGAADAGAEGSDGSRGAGPTLATTDPTSGQAAAPVVDDPKLAGDEPSWPLIVVGGALAVVAATVGAVGRLVGGNSGSRPGPQSR